MELVIVFFRSRDQQKWEPIDRDEIPEWLRDERLWDRLIAGEIIRNTTEDAELQEMHWYAATSVDRLDVETGAILLPPRLLPGGVIIH